MASNKLTPANNLGPSNDNRLDPKAVCPICSKTAQADYAPFCSKRCADVDLHRWLSGGYAVPGEETDSDGVDETTARGDEGF